MNRNLNILCWYDEISHQNHRKPYAYGQVQPVATPLGTMPPFQKVRDNTGAAIESFSIIDWNTGTETDVLSDVINYGLEVVEYASDGYDLIIYPDVFPFSTSFDSGWYYAKMSDGLNTWYSDVFAMCNGLDEKCIKLEYWHSEDLCHDAGRIRYSFPYKTHHYIKSDLGKPTYPYEEQVDRRDGKTFPLQQISAKEYQFVFYGPEHLCDALRVVRLHDHINIYYQGRTFEVDEFFFEPEWLTNGDVAKIVVRFRSGTVAIANGRGYENLTYQADPGSCISQDYTAKATIEEGSDDFLNFTYTNADGETTSLYQNQYILITDLDGDTKLHQKVGTSYVLVAVSDGESVYDEAADEYWLIKSGETTKPKIIEVNDVTGFARGITWANSLVHLYTVDAGGASTLAGIGTAAEFNGGLGISFDPGNGKYVYAEIGTLSCGIMHTTGQFAINLVQWVTPGGDGWSTDGSEGGWWQTPGG